MLKSLYLIVGLCSTWIAAGQSWTSPDSLLGYLNPYRSWFDVHYYNLSVDIDIQRKYINGTNEIYFTATDAAAPFLQIDLAAHYSITAVQVQGKPADYERHHRAVWIAVPPLVEGDTGSVVISYKGRPQPAKMPPWDGGFVWKQDKEGNPWVGVACEGEGASIWWPCKDHFSDEPDSMRMTFTVPDSLIAVGNGKLERQQAVGDKMAFTWRVNNTINPYNVSVNIGNYVSFDAKYLSQETMDTLMLRYYVLAYNLNQAKKHFTQVTPMLQCFETHFGGYPFYSDGYKLVETPYLGMEHQSGIAYGNNYQKGYAGFDQSGLGFDYIIIHESGHEWFGNSITASDLAEIWIHESFTTYSEAVYVECLHDKATANEYMRLQRKMVRNKQPIIGPLDLHFDGWADDNDQYYKGALMLHTLRQAVNDDDKWWAMLKGFSQQYRHQVISTDTVVAYFNQHIDFNVGPFFNQYLRHAALPILEVNRDSIGTVSHQFSFRWVTDVPDFQLPIPVNGKMEMVTNDWRTVTTLTTDWFFYKPLIEQYYITYSQVN